ncbi:hypothetical protein L6452_16668 [Arctium lappa]|uniref:Uncharacterized protein n=1 Tax=Arctium lappa TaxID=4217 RepID=A0ACB9C153_ARCLA|nr:hypothetical protein L6452_16668 [Arctium lappa]
MKFWYVLAVCPDYVILAYVKHSSTAVSCLYVILVECKCVCNDPRVIYFSLIDRNYSLDPGNVHNHM